MTWAWDDDAAAGSWIQGRLGEFGTVGGQIPLGYELYVRIPNSRDPEDNAASLIHRAVDPDLPDQLDRLLDVLRPITADQLCHFAIWHGYGDFYDNGTDPLLSSSIGVVVSVRGNPTADERAAAQRQAEVEMAEHMIERPAAEELTLPHRGYHLWHGPLSAARALEHGSYSPTLMWPDDRSWFVGSDIDSTCTEIGGSRDAVAPLLTDPSWGAVLVSPDDPFGPDWA